MSLSQIQLYIDGNNWDELAKVILELRYDNKIRFTREFLDEFLLSGKYNYVFEENKEKGITDPVETFFDLLFQRLDLSGIELTKEDCLKIIDLIVSLKERIGGFGVSKALEMNRYKNQEYVKLFLDEEFLTKFKKEIYYTGMDNWYFTKRHFEGLTPKEVKKILSNISKIDKNISVQPDSGESWGIFTALFSSPEEILGIDLSIYGITYVEYGTILADMPPEEFKKVVVNALYDGTKTPKEKRDILESLFSYHFRNSDIERLEYTDKEVEKILDMSDKLFSALIPCLNFEQAKKYVKPIESNFRLVLYNKKLSIKQIGEIYTFNVENSISFYRFVKEEDLLDAPHLFKPSILLKELSIFCTEKTFNILNKTWGTDYKWDPKLINFKEIFYKNIKHITFENFEYLIKKTNASNKEICESLKYIKEHLQIYDELKTNFSKNVIQIVNFLRKY